MTASGFSLLGLMKHLAETEHGWFLKIYGGLPEPDLSRPTVTQMRSFAPVPMRRPTPWSRSTYGPASGPGPSWSPAGNGVGEVVQVCGDPLIEPLAQLLQVGTVATDPVGLDALARCGRRIRMTAARSSVVSGIAPILARAAMANVSIFSTDRDPRHSAGSGGRAGARHSAAHNGCLRPEATTSWGDRPGADSPRESAGSGSSLLCCTKPSLNSVPVACLK
jgi:hypothetical protein